MKNSDEWKRQGDVSKTVDAMLEANGGDLDQIKPYRVAQQLGTHPNSSIYAKTRADVERRRGVIAIPVEPVPAELMAGIKAALDQASDQLIATVTEQYAAHISRVSQHAAQRAALESKLYDDEKCAFDDLLETSEHVAQERDLAFARLASIEKECAKLTAKNLRLQGKVDALSALVGGAQKAPQAKEPDGTNQIAPNVADAEDEPPANGKDDHDRPNDIFELMGVDGPPKLNEEQAAEAAHEPEV